MRWAWFFVLCGGVGFIGVLSAVLGFCRYGNTWRKHPSLSDVGEEKLEGKGDVVFENKTAVI